MTDYEKKLFENELKKIQLDIELLEKTIKVRKFINGDPSISEAEARKLSTAFSAVLYEREHLTDSKRMENQIIIAEKELELIRKRKYLNEVLRQLNGQPTQTKVAPAPVINNEPKVENKDKDNVVLGAPLNTEEENKEKEAEVIPVVRTRKPKSDFWEKNKKRIIVGALAALALFAGIKWGYNRGKKDGMEPNSNDEPYKPSEDPYRQEEVVDYVPIPSIIENVPHERTKPTPTPAPTPTPTPTPSPKPDEYVDIVLAPGQSAFNEKTGVEVTYDGSTYIHDENGVHKGNDVELDQGKNGHVVGKDDLNAQNQTPGVPRTGEEQDYDDFIEGATPEEARNVNEAADEFDWESLFADNEGMSLH